MLINFYGHFLSTKRMIAPTIAIVMRMATVNVAKYSSVGGNWRVGCAVGVGVWGSTANTVTAREGYYELLHTNDT